MTTPREDGYRLSAAWEPHERCWMAWPCEQEWWGADLEAARAATAELASAIAEFEPVTMIARPDTTASASLHLRQGIPILPLPHEHSRIRDTSPAFILGPDRRLGGVSFRFDGWGNTAPDYAQDARLAEGIMEHVAAKAYASSLTLEGSQLHHDGTGTALLCRDSVFDLSRNAGVSEADVEAELARCLAIERIVWLAHRLAGPATAVPPPDPPFCFLGPDLVLAAAVDDPADPDHDGLAANLDVLRAIPGRDGQPLRVVTVPLPVRTRSEGRAAMTYTSLYLTNGGVVMPALSDPADKVAFRTVSAALPDRRVIQVDLTALLKGGSGIFALTREQPVA